jgi:hypothetical protein
MTKVSKLINMNNAYDDLVQRTLASIPCDLARLIYLASTRDYNSGLYHHEGLATRYGAESARVALKAAHKDIFYRLVSLSLEDLVRELETYVRVSRETPNGLIQAWQELEPYRVSVPMEVDHTMVQLFLSNIKLALEVLQLRRSQQVQEAQPASSPQPLLGQ